MDRNGFNLNSITEDIVVPYVGTWIEIDLNVLQSYGCPVVPYVGTWIEIDDMVLINGTNEVVPYVGTWIEMTLFWKRLRKNTGSFPTWERG